MLLLHVPKQEDQVLFSLIGRFEPKQVLLKAPVGLKELEKAA
jgi:hypothetical protein